MLGGHGLLPPAGEVWGVAFRSVDLALAGRDATVLVPYSDIVAIEIGGPGREQHRSGGGFIGGGFGVAGAAEGMLIATALNLLTTSTPTTIKTVLCLKTTSAELYLYTSSQGTDELRMNLSPVFTILRQQEAARSTSATSADGDPVIASRNSPIC